MTHLERPEILSLSLFLSKCILSVGKKRLLSNILSRNNVEHRQRWNWGNEGCFSVFDIYIYICGVSYEPSSTRFASFEKFVHFEIFVCTFRILTFQWNFLTLIFISFRYSIICSIICYIIYLFIFFILRENLKSIARFEISVRIFARLKYIYSPYS